MSDIPIGKIAFEQSQKDGHDQNSREFASETADSLIKDMYEAVERGRKQYPHTDFYIAMLTKKEKLLPNVLRNLLVVRRSCPTPAYDQAVYRYNYKREDLEFLWVIPDIKVSALFLSNISMVEPHDYPLLQYIIKHRDGELHELARKLNKEQL